MNEKISRKEYGEKFILRVLFNKFICLIAMLPMATSLRTSLLSFTGMKINKNCFVASYVFMDDQYPELITIGDRVVISYRTAIIAHDDSKGIVSPVNIERDAWIGACTTILPGVIVGEKAVVGAGTTIAKDVPTKTTVVSAKVRIINKAGE